MVLTGNLEIAYAANAIEMRDISGAEFRFAKTLTMPFFGSGMVDIPPEARSEAKTVVRCRWFSSSSMAASLSKWERRSRDLVLGKGVSGRFREVSHMFCSKVACQTITVLLWLWLLWWNVGPLQG